MLHLTATDSEDLIVLSAQLQDAVIRFGDIRFLKTARKFALVANRFAWDALPERQRRRCGVTFTSVLKARRAGPKTLNPDTILSLLSISFTAAPQGPELAGTVHMHFSGGHSFALEVDCLDATLDDLGPVWSTDTTPEHESKT